MDEKKTTTNLSPNVASALCYAPFLGVIPAVVFLITEKNQTVRLNAVQGVLLFAAWFVLFMLPLLGMLLTVGFFILWLVLAVKAYQGEMMKLPLVTEWAEKILKKV